MDGTAKIRLADVRDFVTIHAGLLALARSMGAETKMQSTPADIVAHGFGDARAFEVLIAEIGDTFAGLCITSKSYSTWRGEPGIYVQDLYIDERCQGRGIGEKLLRAAARRGRAQGAAYLRLSVDVDNIRAQSFYQRLGILHSDGEQIHMIKGEAFDAFAEEETNQT